MATVKRKLNEKDLDYDDVENKLKGLGSENFGVFYNVDTGHFIYPKKHPIIISVLGRTQSGKTTFIKNTLLTTIPGFSTGEISVLYLQHSKIDSIQEKLKSLHYIVHDLHIATYDNWISTVQTFVDSKKPDAPKCVICDDFTNVLNTASSAVDFRHLINTYHNHKNVTYIIITHTATAENASSKALAILKKESTFLLCNVTISGRMLMTQFISQFPPDVKEVIKRKFKAHSLLQNNAGHVLIHLENGDMFDDYLTLIDI